MGQEKLPDGAPRAAGQFQERVNRLPGRQPEIAGVTWARDRIWCLGTRVGGCKYVPWESGGVSFADCDVLIVDARSLFRQDPLLLKSDEMKYIAHEIYKRSCTSDFMLISIVSDEQFPTSYNPEQSDPGADGNSNQDPMHNSEYFWHPDSDNIDMYAIGSGATRLDAGWKSTELARFEKYFKELNSFNTSISMRVPPIMFVAETKSKDLVACMYRRHSSDAVMIMLPPLRTPEESVGKVLEVLGLDYSTPEPEWSKLVDIPETRAIARKIGLLKKQVTERKEQIRALEEDFADRRSLAKLLYATGGELEGAVLAAFKTLSLDAKPGEPGREDLVLTPSVDARCTCYVEVKGVENKIKRDDLRQLAEWVDGGWSKGIKSKGILVANMHRLSDIRTSKDERSRLEPDQMEFAQARKFCIVPAHLLFDLCVGFAGGRATDLEKIERALIDTAGFVKPGDLGLET